MELIAIGTIGAAAALCGVYVGMRLTERRAPEKREPEPEAEEPLMGEDERRCWENLLRYDGTVQEEEEKCD